MRPPIFITGIGTGVGKTIISAILVEALQADYWKPIQAGIDDTDSLQILKLISDKSSVIHSEVYKFKLPASPHIAAKNENITIEFETIEQVYNQLPQNKQLIIEGAGGLLVPLNESQFVIDLIHQLKAKVVLVSRNYLGSINHSLLTAAYCKQNNVEVLGWIFNDQFMNYEAEIAAWSGYKKIASIPYSQKIDKNFIIQQAEIIKTQLQVL